jgi:two-component system sensor kinase FixL
MKIASKISFAFLITALLLTGLCAPAYYIIAKRCLEERIYAHLETTTQSRAHHIELYLKEHEEKVGIMADSDEVENALKAFKNKESYSTEELKKESSLELQKVVGIGRDFCEIFVLNADGKIVTSTEEKNIGLDRSADACFLVGRERPYIKDAYLSTTTNRRSIAVSAPVLDDETGECLGVLVARLDLTGLDQIACDRTGLGKTGEIYIINKDGYMITPSRFKEDTFLKLKVDTENARAAIEDCKTFGGNPHQHVPFTYADYRGVKVLGIHSHIPRMKWGLIAEINAKDAFAPLARIKIVFFIVMILAPLGAWLIGIFFSGIISKPIRKLQAGAEIIGGGNLDYKVAMDTKDEIGRLSRAFDKMCADLKESHANLKDSHKQLEKKVQERTVELSSTNKKLQEEIEQRSLAHAKSRQHIKQLQCLYGLSKLIEKQKIPLEKIFQETPDLIRNAYHSPDVISVRITFEGIQYKTDKFEKSRFSQYAPINVRGEEAGGIEVYWLGEEIENDPPPFHQEERSLLNAVAVRLGRTAERKKAAETLRLFRNLIDRSNDSIFVIEPEWGCLLDVNDRACESLGYTREELLSMVFKNVDQSILDDSAWKEHVHKLKNKADLVIQGEHQHKNGKTFCVETSLKLVEHEKKDYILAAARDMTERKQAEEELRASEQRLKTILESILTGVFIIDAQSHRIIDVNPMAEAMIGLPKEDIVGNICHRFVCPAEQGKCPITDLGQMVDRSERLLVKPDGAEFPILKNVTIMRVRGHEYLVESFVDITERKLAEKEQAQLLEEVESVNRELKDFAYIVSHDLKAPLRGIKTLTEWLAADYADRLDDNGKEQMDLLLGRVQRMHNLVDGVLQYSRVGRIEEEKVRINLNELVAEVIDTVAPPENIEISIENQLPEIECEETRMTQIFQNLLSNAVKYMDKPKGRIRIGCVEENDFWKFSVADNGPGIEEKYFERVFRIFQTLSPRDEFESTGVGLTVVKKIVELYGGRIWIESKIGKGSNFFFTLSKREVEAGGKNAKLQANIVS